MLFTTLQDIFQLVKTIGICQDYMVTVWLDVDKVLSLTCSQNADMEAITYGVYQRNPIPSVITDNINQPIKLKYSSTNFHLYPYIISLLFRMASIGFIPGLSYKMYQLMEYRKAAMIPGINNNKDQSRIKINNNKFSRMVAPKN